MVRFMVCLFTEVGLTRKVDSVTQSPFQIVLSPVSGDVVDTIPVQWNKKAPRTSLHVSKIAPVRYQCRRQQSASPESARYGECIDVMQLSDNWDGPPPPPHSAWASILASLMASATPGCLWPSP